MPQKASTGEASGADAQRVARQARSVRGVGGNGAAGPGGLPVSNRSISRLLGGAGADIAPRFDVEPDGPRRMVSQRQTAGGASPALLSRIGHDAGAGHIRRHASWEHKMLGDVDPATLEVIASGKSVAAEEEKKTSFVRNKLTPGSMREPIKTVTNDQGATITLENVLHTVDQEIARLKIFQSAPPRGEVADATKKLQDADAERRKGELKDSGNAEEMAQKRREIDDAKWDVRLVELTLSDASTFLVTYGELNTLADFYGSAAEISQTPADNFKGILGGVREESLRKFMRLRNELTVVGPKQYNPDADEHHFEGAIGNRGQSKTGIGGDAFGELKLMGKMPGYGQSEARQKVGDREETSYIAGLVRNACHFAPQSWHSWAAAHNKAIAFAKESFAHSREVARLETQRNELRDGVPPGLSEDSRRAIAQSLLLMQAKIEATKKLAATTLNSALIENGFGDHFLQDSYAAGHLINKTQVMQWFAKWLDTKGRKRDYSTEAEWRQIQQIAYGQQAVAGSDLYDTETVGEEASNDPQSVENMEGGWRGRFEALGLSIPSVLRTPGTDEFLLFTWWQEQAMDGRLLKADAEDLAAGPVGTPKRIQAALKKLIDDGVVYYNWYSTKDRAKGAEAIGVGNKSLRLKAEYIPKKTNEAKFKAAVAKSKQGDNADYAGMAEAVTYADYHKFLNHGYLQLSSNVLHDYFCKNGLQVATAEGEAPFKIYGDNAMLDKESAKGVKHSSITSRMSRDSIYELASAGETAKSTQAIAGRFPTYVTPTGGAQMSLADWHNNGALQKFCFDTVFDDAAALFSKSTIAAKGKLAEQASKDDKVEIHSGEAF